MAKGFIKANDREKRAFCNQLEKVATSQLVDDVLTCTYAPGWDDEAVYNAVKAEVREGISAVHVKRYRLEVFGALAVVASKNPDRDSDIWDAIEELRRDIAELKQREMARA